MGIFDLFKKKKPCIQILFDNFFEDLVIVDVVAAIDIPLTNINGILRRPGADIFFKGYYQWIPVRINSFTDKMDTVFWLFDNFCVLEMDSTNDLAKQFIVLKHSMEGLNELPMVTDTFCSFKLLPLKEAIIEMKEPFEIMFFKEAIDFFIKHQEDDIKILKHKYY